MLSCSNRIQFCQMSLCLLWLPFGQLRQVTTMTLLFTLSLFSSMPSKLMVSQYLMKLLDHNESIKLHKFIICMLLASVLRLLLHCGTLKCDSVLQMISNREIKIRKQMTKMLLSLQRRNMTLIKAEWLLEETC